LDEHRGPRPRIGAAVIERDFQVDSPASNESSNPALAAGCSCLVAISRGTCIWPMQLHGGSEDSGPTWAASFCCEGVKSRPLAWVRQIKPTSTTDEGHRAGRCLTLMLQHSHNPRYEPVPPILAHCVACDTCPNLSLPTPQRSPQLPTSGSRLSCERHGSQRHRCRAKRCYR